MCNCKSYNAQIGEVPEVILKRPDWLPEGERLNGVPVDACIAETIEHLWLNNVVTLGSCCGHNGRVGNMSIILGESENVERAYEILNLFDKRPFTLQQWQLVDVSPKKGGVPKGSARLDCPHCTMYFLVERQRRQHINSWHNAPPQTIK